MANRFTQWIKQIVGIDSHSYKEPATPAEKKTPASHVRSINISEWPSWPAGSKPYSLRLPEVRVYRYNSNDYLDLSDTWYHMFWDLNYKWDAKSRYSAKDISPGHFFSVVPEGAQAEMSAYNADLTKSELLELTISIDNLLDLTSPEALRWFYKRHFEPEKDWHWAAILDSMFAQELGGDSHNAFMGHKAILDDYNGVVFFGARAVEPYWDQPGSLMERNWNLIGFNHEMMLDDPACINMLIYFAHNVIRSTHSISTAKGQMMINRLYSASISEIDEVFARDPARPPKVDMSFESEVSRAKRIFWVSKPAIIEEDVGGNPSNSA